MSDIKVFACMLWCCVFNRDVCRVEEGIEFIGVTKTDILGALCNFKNLKDACCLIC